MALPWAARRPSAKQLTTLAMALAIGASVVACRPAPTVAQLDADNPIRPLAAPPFGMEDFFKEAPSQPVPARARLGRWLFYDTRLS